MPNDLLGRGTILVCQMEVPGEETADLIRRAAARGATTLLNLAPATAMPPDLFGAIDFLIANAGEAVTLGDDPARVARRFRRALVVTQGAAGATAFVADGSRLNVPALAIEPVDTTGAGDTFVGALAAGLDQGLALSAALRRASAAAGLACLARGAQTAMPDAAAIDAAVARLPA